MSFCEEKTTETITVDSIKLSGKRNKLIVLILSLTVLVFAIIWGKINSNQFFKQTTRINQEHLLDIARIEAKFIKNLLLEKGDYSLKGIGQNITIGQKGYIWLIDENGIILSHPDKDQIGKDKMVIRKAAFPDYDWSQLEQIVEKMKKGEEGIGIYQSAWWTEENPKVHKKVIGFAPIQIGEKKWSVAACMSFDEIAGPITEHTIDTYIMAGVVLLLFSTTGTVFYRSQTRENLALQSEVQEHKKTKEALQEAHDRLEQRVEDRTAELKKANNMLRIEFEERRSTEEKSRQLEQQILRINDTVQGNIGRDLHDGLLQQLTGVTFFCDTLVEKLSDVSSPCAADASEISGHLRQLMTWLRDLAKGLYPTDLDKNGLGSALEMLARTTSHLFKISVVFQSDETINISEPDVALHLYRIAQEAVNNAIKHGDAKHISIRLSHYDDKILLSIKDDGSGFSMEKAALGTGLQSINFRAKAIGGIIDIQSVNGKETIVSCCFSNLDKAQDCKNG